jgi:hypothetical protein
MACSTATPFSAVSIAPSMKASKACATAIDDIPSLTEELGLETSLQGPLIGF